MSVLLAVYRVRGPILLASALLVAVVAVIRSGWRIPLVEEFGTIASVAGMAGIAVALALTLAGPRLLGVRAPVRIVSPVTGRWLAVNSPASKVPSHGVRAYGQAYAIDLVAEPEGAERPLFGAGPAFRPPQDFPAFGLPVRAMCDGTVVRAWDRLDDHRSRSSYAALAVMVLEGMVREFGGPRFVVGNHVVVRGDDGVFALVAHLRRGSVRVRPGDRVAAGDVIAACGNTGNTTEPHVHAQLMDRASLWTAQGVPFSFADVRIAHDDAVRDGVPVNGEHLLAD